MSSQVERMYVPLSSNAVRAMQCRLASAVLKNRLVWPMRWYIIDTQADIHNLGQKTVYSY